jgi:hypothetical protein
LIGERKEYHEVAEEEFCHLDFFGERGKSTIGIPKISTWQKPLLQRDQSPFFKGGPKGD